MKNERKERYTTLFDQKRKEYVMPLASNDHVWFVVKDGWRCKCGELVGAVDPTPIAQAVEVIDPERTRVSPLELEILASHDGTRLSKDGLPKQYLRIVPWLRHLKGWKRDAEPPRAA